MAAVKAAILLSWYIVMKFYWVDADYIRFLSERDDNVFNYQHEDDKRISHQNKYDPRPFIGILLKINNVDFIAPLSSPKKWHEDIEKHDNRYLKITKKRGKEILDLGVVRICNMIPVNDSVCTEINFPEEKTKDRKYFYLLQSQYNFLKEDYNIAKLTKRADKIYKISNKPTHVHNYSCCNFDLLASEINNYPIEQ